MDGFAQAQKGKMMNDLISRQAVLDIAFKYCPDDDGVCSEAGNDLRNMLDEIENLPPAEPKTGKWTEEDGLVICSECGEEHGWIDYRANFCENCGADMRGEQK